MNTTNVFRAQLGRKERLLANLVGRGVFIGIPLVLGVAFAVGLRTPEPLLFPVFFGLVYAVIMLFRVKEYAIDDAYVIVRAPLKETRFPIAELSAVEMGMSAARGIGLARSEGFCGSYGVYWNREWGRFKVYVTDATRAIQLRFGERRVFVSPLETERFLEVLAEMNARR
jgi:hypothetical protein